MDLSKYITNKTLVVWIVATVLIVQSIDGEPLCLAKKDSKWDPSEDTCIPCPPCPRGNGRNFSSDVELPKGNHGDLGCLPCIPCPKGTFDVEFNNDCQPCDNLKCNRFQRNVYEECSTFSDVRCGSCKSGFVDEYSSIDFPCSPKDPASDGPMLPPHTHYEQLTTTTVPLKHSLSDLQTLDHKSETVPVIIAACGSSLVVLLSVIAILYIRKRIERKKLKEISSPTEGSEWLLDLEMDGPRPAVPHGGLASVPAVPHGELASVHGRRTPHQELSTGAYSTSGPSGMPYTCAGNVSRLDKQVCHCDLSNTNICNTCNTYAEQFRDIKIQKGDTIVSIVSSNVCHDPVPLIHELNVPDPDHYQIDNDRQRNPEGVSQKEYIQRTLNRWLETVKEVDLLRLSRALCASNFHHINVKIREYLNDTSISDNVNNEDTNSPASMM